MSSRARTRTTMAGLAAASLAVNLLLIGWSGVRVGGDTVRYTDGAARLAAGAPLEGMQRLFPAYVALVATSTALGLGFAGVVVLQVLVAAVATIALYEIGRSLAGAAAGVGAAALFVLDVDLSRWHAYVLTDSLYISLVVIAAYSIHAASERGGWRYAGAIAVVALAALLRPQGRLLALGAAVYWIVRAPAGSNRRMAIVCAAALIAGVVLSSRGALEAEAETPSHWLGAGVVVWNDPGSNIAMPWDAEVDLSRAGPTSIEPVRYVLRHPAATARLAATRVAVELGHARRFYSRGHNATVVISLAILYALAAAGVAQAWRQPLAQLLLGLVSAHLLMVAATFADWDGRFLLYVLPLIGVFSAAGLAALTMRRPAAAA